MKVLITLLILSCISPVLASKHHVFLIHGIGDSEKAFGAANIVLNNLLNESSEETQFFLESFEYQTGNDDLNTVDFAKSFTKFFKEYFKEKTMLADDKFSILAHSQGGLVTMNWLYHSFKGDAEFTDFNFIRKHMKTFISAATPYGGTEIITLALLFRRLRQYLQFGKKELDDMYFPSAMISKMKGMLLGNDPEFLKFLHSLNILNIVGVAHRLPPLSSSAANLQDDTTVPVSSANMNFYYLKNHKRYFPGLGEKIPVSETKFYKNATVVPVNAAHISVLFVPGIVKIPLECKILSECDHPAINFYLNHLLSKPLPKVEEVTRSFVVKLKLEVSKKSLSYSNRDPALNVTFDSKTFNASKVFGKKFFLDDIKEKESSRVYEYYYAGKLSEDNLKEHIVNIVIKGPTPFHIRREADFKISPGYQTTLDLKLMSIGDY
ncbi:hypothetical protein [Halobacteriovorax sp. JY17]|uniref:alpha/beta hydrolase n=1 Tax=Halobacteriovorax sp. JY17 TaxID=2014617 RepID=UPI000C428F9B|nr:hypothetical protein [Halobacteriovorax sp. JY17]PIK15031.1 MAG: hypothetical protein CES88_11905 [Halobacteriovorax sp. JY17]